ncbi:glycosyltransferase [Rheinheimera sp. MMS21-TC3]|uniref:glycosyltransferase n=1 Tax=Rheinheimera sp. MMS21-TC3 TaxID=3072790 RepID=UPI0028C4ADD7|nr:glycosyltransferase [Rheinheimera sp. MMS21-TC3]WNO61686.1 glycosyltransferase [Rheinheimera sp. MMS21-TC3]
MRIVHIFSALYQGGAENQLELLISQSQQATPDVEHIVISLKSDKTALWQRLEQKNIPIYSCNLNNPLNLKAVLTLRNLLKQLNSAQTVFQCWMYHANFFTSIAAARLPVKLVWAIRRSQIPTGITGLISKASAWLSHRLKPHIISNSEAGLASHGQAGYYLAKSLVIANGFATDAFAAMSDTFTKPNANQAELKQNYQFAVIGRYAQVKGHKFLLEAILLLQQQLPAAEFGHLTFTFVGRDIATASALKPYLDNPIIRQHCQFIGEVADVSEVLQDSDCLILPSLSEGFPNVLVEAMLTNKYCIATDVGDVKRILADKVPSIKPGCAEQLCRAMLDYLHNDRQQNLAIGRELGDLARSQFSIAASWQAYLRLYSMLLKAC